jgi:hypothetical protein
VLAYNLNELAAVCQFPISINDRRHIVAANLRTGFQQEMRAKPLSPIVGLDMTGIFAINSAAGTPWIWIGYIFVLSR